MGCRVQKPSAGASKPVCEADACVRWYAHSHHLLDIRGVEILGGLACVAPRDGKIDARLQSVIQEGRTSAPRNSFTGVPVHWAFRLMGSHPVPSGFVPIYSTSPLASR